MTFWKLRQGNEDVPKANRLLLPAEDGAAGEDGDYSYEGEGCNEFPGWSVKKGTG